MKSKSKYLNWSCYRKVSIDSRITGCYDIGISTPKGLRLRLRLRLRLHFYGPKIYISKDGIYYYLSNYDCISFFISRLIGLINATFFLALFIFMMVSHIIIGIFIILIELFLILTLCFKFKTCIKKTSSDESNTNRELFVVLIFLFGHNLLTNLALLFHLILRSLQVVIPEFISLLLKQHKLGTPK